MSHIKNSAWAEITASTLDTTTAICWDAQQTPAFGSLATMQYAHIFAYGLVTNITIAPKDSSRSPHAFKLTPEQLLINQPHISALIQTTLTITMIGFAYAQEMVPDILTLPLPPPLHTWVCNASPQIALQLLGNQIFLEKIIKKAVGFDPDDAVLSMVGQLISDKKLPKPELYQIGELYSQLINADYQRVRRFLDAIERMTCSY